MGDGETAVLSARDERADRGQSRLRRSLGPQICGFLEEPTVVEVMLNPDGSLWVERQGAAMERVGELPITSAEALIMTVAGILNTTVTRENPILECELPLDGSRFEALMPPVVTRPTFTIRRKAGRVFTLAEYVDNGIMTAGQRAAIERAIRERNNILVVGGTGTGKTTLTNAIIAGISEIDPQSRLVIIEDTNELQCSAPNAVQLRAVDQVDMLRLLKATMRLRPDRILVGEVRGPEALSLLKAWNTGHPGGVATVHANNALAGLQRMESLCSEAAATPRQQEIATAVNLVVSIGKTSKGRRVREVLKVHGWDANGYRTEQVEEGELINEQDA